MPEPGVVAVVAGEGWSDQAHETVASLRRSHEGLTVKLASSGAGASAVAVANRLWDEQRCHLLIVAGAVDFPRGLLDAALPIVDDDRRVGTVSFLCDDAGFLTFPRPREGGEQPRGDLDPDRTTRALRSTGPELAPAPIPYALGPAVLVSSHALSAVGPLRDVEGADRVAAALVDFSLRGRQRGFFAFLDPSTFCRRRSPGGPLPVAEPEATLVKEAGSPVSALSTVHRAARAKVCGLRVLIDAARLTALETGTQVATVALIRALARRADVAQVCVALAGDLPHYAASLENDPKIDARTAPDRDFSVFGRVDVAHRPFQPDSPADMEACRAVADRTAITVLDLIAYHAVSYQPAPEYWTTYRDWLRQSIAQADAVVAPTHDVRRQILLERLPVDPERVVVAELGTDHLAGDAPESQPARVSSEGEFAVVLGADYTHKNRDLAVRAHRELRERGFDLSLVMAGMEVYGSSREWEAAARAPDQKIVVLPDVSSEERNWLLRHASLVLYPTSAEGFGFVPFEAARLGTPSAFVPFGPLAELAGDLPVQAADWSPVSLADAAAALLADPALARAQVEATVAAGDRYTWDAAAAKLADVYRSLLARPVAARQIQVGTAEPSEAAEELRKLREEHEGLRQAHEQVQRSVPVRLARRANDVGDALRRRARAICDGPPPGEH